MFRSVLIANRGEIACRIIRTLDRIGIESVAVYSDADRDAPHVRRATQAVRIGPADARRSYLDIDAVLSAARDTGAEAIHPGYGFLAENAEFAAACAAAGIVFIGPPAAAIETMGDKIRARHAVESRGVSTVPGIAEPGLDDAALIVGARRIGFPVLVKPSAGGGGKGMHRVDAAPDLPAAIAQARREAASAFGDDTLFIERFVTNPRHIEVQVLADAHGSVVHLGERECSLQRRHQKVIEEAPSVLLTPAQREAIGEAACETARSVGYVGAGTVEFIVSGDRPDEPFFMEMNTRLQVEHPVTEMVTGVDLVEQQLRIAAGEPLALLQAELRLDGHAVEARIYAEDPAAGFIPTGGTVADVQWPVGDGLRIDAGIAAGSVISPNYDPMLAKVIAHGATRAEALARLDTALAETHVLGVTTNTAFLRALLAESAVQRGALDTGLIDRDAERLAVRATPSDAFAQAAVAAHAATRTPGPGPWQRDDGWRLAGPRGIVSRFADGDSVATVRLTRQPASDSDAYDAVVERGSGFTTVFEVAAPHTHHVTRDGDVWLGRDDGVWLLERARTTRRAAAGSEPGLTSPMPGTVVAVGVVDGERVAPGQAIVSVEAMKMEHVLRAPVAGTVRVHAQVGQTVRRGQELASVTPGEAEAA